MKLLLLLVAAPVLVGATEPVRLLPAGKWVLDYGDKSCRLLRAFGEPAKPTTLILEQAAPDGPLSMVVISNALQRSTDAKEIKAHFLPVAGITHSFGLSAKTAESDQPAVMWPRIDFLPVTIISIVPTSAKIDLKMRAGNYAERPKPIDPSQRQSMLAEKMANAQKTSAIRIEADSSPLLTLEVGSMGKPYSMMRDCLRDLVRSWGLDPDIQERIAKPASKKSRGSWFSSLDYPKSGLNRGEESLVTARLIVNEKGGVTKCTSLSHFNAPEFGRAVCSALTKRGRFFPAELADGTKVSSYYIFNVRFKLP